LFVECFIIQHCDNFVIGEIISKVLDESFDFEQSEKLKSYFEKHKLEFQKFMQSEEEKRRRKRVHSDLSETKLIDKTLKHLPKKKIKNGKEYFYGNESSNKIKQNIEKEDKEIEVNITLEERKSFTNKSIDTKLNFKDNISYSSTIDNFNFKNIKEKLNRNYVALNLPPQGKNDLKRNSSFISRETTMNKLSNNSLLEKGSNNTNGYIELNINEVYKKNVINNDSLNQSFITLDDERINSAYQNSNIISSNAKTEYGINAKSFHSLNDPNINNIEYSNLSYFPKGNISHQSFVVNSNNKSTNFSSFSNKEYLNYRNLIEHDNKNRRNTNSNDSLNIRNLGFNKYENHQNSEEFIKKNSFINENSILTIVEHKANNLSDREKSISSIGNIFNNIAGKKEIKYPANNNKIRPGINGKLNYTITNIQKQKKEKSKKKNSKNKPEVINKLFEKLAEKLNNTVNYNANSDESNLLSTNLEINSKSNNCADQLKDNNNNSNLRQKGVDEYFGKINIEDRNNNNNNLINGNDNSCKINLKNFINNRFYQKKFDKTPEKLDVPKFSKRKKEADNNISIVNVKTKNEEVENTKKENNSKKENFSEKTYDLLRFNNKTNRSTSEEPKTKKFLEKNDLKTSNELTFSKSPIALQRQNFILIENLSIINSSNNNKNLDNTRKNSIKENQTSSDDEVLAYSTPTKSYLNKNIRKKSKDMDNINSKLKNNTGLNLLNLFKQIKK